MAELAGVLVGNYFLLECLSREGMVETYRARPTTRGGYDVILRLFRPAFPDPTAFRDHFAAEVEKVWRCSHENIQPLLEFGTGDELLYCATRVTDSITLEEYLAQQRYLPVPIVLQLIVQLCSALQYAHDHEIVHGNVQPNSILIHENNLLLTHFSMKRAYQDGDPLATHIEEGNPAYLAPEQSLGMIQPASDIYAIGVLLFRLLTGTLPYDDRDAGDIALKHANEPIPSLRLIRPEIPEALELVVQTALAKTPEARFPSALALAQALHAALIPDFPQVISSMPERHIVVKARRTHFTWSRLASFLTLSVLLFSLLGTSFFIFSLPQHIYDLRKQPIWSIVQSGILHLTPASTSTTKPAAPNGSTSIPGTVSSTPAGKATPPIHVTPTVGIAPTPTGSVTPTPPTVTPPPASLLCASGTLSIDGSPNIAPLLQQAANDYTQQCPNLSITLGSSGSRAALNAVQQGDIDAASSDLTARSQRNLTDQPIAALLYAVIVSPDVQLNGLSSTQLQEIYQGNITNWAEVGGPDEPITVVLHSSDTITTIFRAFVLNGQPIALKGSKLKKDWVQAVAQTPGAISYVPLIEAQDANVSILAIDGSVPTAQSLAQGSYPFWSVEHLYTQGNGSSQLQSYLPFLLSNQEASIFSRYGAVPINLLSQSVLSSHLPGPEI